MKTCRIRKAFRVDRVERKMKPKTTQQTRQTKTTCINTTVVVVYYYYSVSYTRE